MREAVRFLAVITQQDHARGAAKGCHCHRTRAAVPERLEGLGDWRYADVASKIVAAKECASEITANFLDVFLPPSPVYCKQGVSPGG
jgi:hypothetical protein